MTLGVVVAGLLVLGLTGCRSPSNDPEAYTDTNAAGTVVVEHNFLEACRDAGTSESDCRCIYDGLVEAVPFDEFEEIQGQLEDDPADVPESYVEVADGCVAGPVDRAEP
ncbi:MAG: hypothetical protein U5R31_03810 [Acidimicrobiia bacterium]|nr:hypothetical protein [Acidimicrobiia bacterium]